MFFWLLIGNYISNEMKVIFYFKSVALSNKTIELFVPREKIEKTSNAGKYNRMILCSKVQLV
jgi:hypothetical protein